MEQRKKYIAYGSNLNIEQMTHRCPTARVVGTGELQGYELLFRGAARGAVATVEPREGASVPVLIWDIGPEDERNLDRYEGYPRLYRREDLDVATAEGTESIMAYVMNEGYDIGIPGKHYYGTILCGYEQAGFDQRILRESVRHCQMLMNEAAEGHGMEGRMWTQQQLY